MHISSSSGPAFSETHSSRGAAFGDIDNDGLIEIAVNNQNEAPSLFKQQTKPPGHWVLLRLIGTRSNRSAIGASVKLTAGGHSQFGVVKSGGSYLSQSDFRLHFGLGPAIRIDTIEISWPSGSHRLLEDQPCDQILTIQEEP
jgi:enediyne biosynthesis protein E4